MSYTTSNTLEDLACGKNLPSEQMHWAMQDIMTGQWQNEQVAAFLMGLRAKGETVEEITAMSSESSSRSLSIISSLVFSIRFSNSNL